MSHQSDRSLPTYQPTLFISSRTGETLFKVNRSNSFYKLENRRCKSIQIDRGVPNEPAASPFSPFLMSQAKAVQVKPQQIIFFLSLHIAHDPARRNLLDGRMRIWIYQRSNSIQVVVSIPYSMKVVAVSDPLNLSFRSESGGKALNPDKRNQIVFPPSKYP